MASPSGTSSVIERALQDTIAQLTRMAPTPRTRAVIIEARRLLGMVSSWKAIPPRATTRRELYANALRLFEKAGVNSPQVDPSSFPDPTQPPIRSPAAHGSSRPPAVDQAADAVADRVDERRERREAPTTPPPPMRSSAPPASSTRPAGGRMSSRPPRSSRRAELAPGILLVRPEGLEWRALPMVPGIDVKVLFRDEEAGIFRALVRMAPGAELPRHQHAAHEEIYIVEGTAVHAGVEARAGEYCHSDPGSVHEAISSPAGCTLFLVGSERDELLPK
jgi:quercetin dioxygenase-like cupin family protein